MDILKMIADFGITIVIAAIFIYMALMIQRWILHEFKCLKEAHEQAIQNFTKVTTSFNNTVENHIKHESEILEQLILEIKMLRESISK